LGGSLSQRKKQVPGAEKEEKEELFLRKTVVFLWEGRRGKTTRTHIKREKKEEKIKTGRFPIRRKRSIQKQGVSSAL